MKFQQRFQPVWPCPVRPPIDLVLFDSQRSAHLQDFPSIAPAREARIIVGVVGPTVQGFPQIEPITHTNVPIWGLLADYSMASAASVSRLGTEGRLRLWCR